MPRENDGLDGSGIWDSPLAPDAGGDTMRPQSHSRSGDGMADMRVLEARAARRAGSSPVPSTSLRRAYGWQASQSNSFQRCWQID